MKPVCPEYDETFDDEDDYPMCNLGHSHETCPYKDTYCCEIIGW